MFQYIEARDDIARFQRQLEATIRSGFTQTAIRDIGYPGGRQRRAQVATNGRYWFWTADLRASNATPRRLNWFGVLNENPGVSITVEINIAFKGHSNQAAGFFARDPKSQLVYFLHSGRVGGGTKGVGKDSLLAWATIAKQPLIEVVDSKGRIRRGLIVMPIEGKAAIRSAIRYVDLVREFKIVARNGFTAEFRRREREFKAYFAEGRGRRRRPRSGAIDYVSRHGEIVDALNSWRVSQPMPKNSQIVKNVLIDLGVAVGDNLVELFEVKPNAARSDAYSAIGQLLVHARTPRCRRVFVISEADTLPEDIEAALRRLQIETLRFRLGKSEVRILES